MKRKHSAPSISFFAFQDIITSVVGIFVLIALTMALQLVERTVEGHSSDSLVADQLSETLKFVREQTNELEKRFEMLSRQQASSAGVNRFNAESIAAEIDQETQMVELRIKRSMELADELQRSLIVAEGQHQQLVEQSLDREPERQDIKKMLDKTNALESQLGKLETENPLIFRDSNVEGKSLVVVDIHRSQVRILDLSNQTAVTVNDEKGFKSWLNGNSRDNLHFLLLVRPDGITTFEDCREAVEGSGASYGFDVLSDGKNLQMASEIGVVP